MRRVTPTVLWPAAAMVGLMPLLAAIDPVLRYNHLLPAPDPLSVWPLTPDITLGILFAGWLYIAGQRERRVAWDERHPALRHLAFFGGLAVVFLALQSPIETLSDHLFIVHQVEHMMLRTAAPILLVLSVPQAALLRGLPDWARRRVASPVFGSRVFRWLGILGHPAVATAVFVGTTYFWMIPRYHDLAILDEPVHYLWHTTLLLSGLIFFWRILDPRPYPLGASLGTRLWMFWLASMGNILLGSYLSLKTGVIYHAYDEMGRLWGIGGQADETLGGLTMWIPGSMMFAVTAVLMIYRWAQFEERRAARPPGDGTVAAKTTSAEFFAQRRGANRRMAAGLLCFVATVLLITFSSVMIYHFSARFPQLLAAF